MSSSSKNKGSGGERELAKILKERGYPVYRTYASGAGLEKGDLGNFRVRDDLLFHVEVKRQERISLQSWWDQAVRDCPPEAEPLLVFRRNRESWRVCMELETLLDLLEEK
jgi:Holliday junction resolvase